MIKPFLFLSLSLVGVNGFAAMDKTTTPAVQITYDANYIYYKVPAKVAFDPEQQAALKEGVEFIAKQVKHFGTLNAAMDPDGDLKAVSDAMNTLDTQTGLLVQAVTTLYSRVAQHGLSLNEGLPSAFLVYGGVEYDRNIFTMFRTGGSVMIGAVIVPMKVTRISRRNPSQRDSYYSFADNASLILIPVANLGAGVTENNGVGTNQRFGVGLVWGELNLASEFVGLTAGGSVTLDIGAGLNLKAFALRNFAKPTFISNVVVMAGIEKGTPTVTNGQIPFLKLNAESHFNLGWIFDAGATFTGITRFAGSFLPGSLSPSPVLNPGTPVPGTVVPAPAPVPGTPGTLTPAPTPTPTPGTVPMPGLNPAPAVNPVPVAGAAPTPGTLAPSPAPGPLAPVLK